METKPKENEKSSTFIDNSPCGQDLFASKTQERVAVQVEQTLIEEDSCNVIGLDGQWGSGKSNLLGILQERFEKFSPDKYFFFIYDAWGHQEDLQRRSILEEMTEYLVNVKEILPIDPWQEQLEKLLSKSVKTHTKSVPSVSIGIAVSALLLILAPVFSSISDTVGNPFFKVFVAALPLIGFTIIARWFYRKKTNPKQNFRKRIKAGMPEFFHLYQEKQKENTTHETISEAEPTVNEFRSWMRDISDDLSAGNKHLVLVFDNMDRLPEEKVLDLWSSIHTFFAEKSYNNIKVIIPFDRKHIEKAFDQGNDESKYGKDFINKTFDVVYRISPPIMSDWRGFFKAKWESSVILNPDDEELDKILQAYDHLAPKKTPREIIAFINEYISILQVNPEVKGRYIALFILNKELFSEGSDVAILKPELGSLNYLYRNDEELSKNLAALVYQIEPQTAMEVVFTDKLVTALNNNDQEEIQIIGQSDSIQYLLLKVINRIENLPNSILGLNNIQEKVDVYVWDNVFWKFKSDLGDSDNAIIQEFHLILLTNSSQKEVILEQIINGLRLSKDFVAVDYYKSLEKIKEILQTISLDIDLGSFLAKKETSPDDFIALLKESGRSVQTIKVTCDVGQLNKHLLEIEDTESLENSNHLKMIPINYNLDNALRGIEDKVEESSDREIVGPYFQFYKNISRGKIGVDLISDKYIHDFFNESPKEKDAFYYDLICMRLVRKDSFSVMYNNSFESVLEETDEKFVVKVANSIGYFRNYGGFLLDQLQFDSALSKAVARELNLSHRPGQRAEIIPLLQSFDAIVTTIEIDDKLLLENLCRWYWDDVKATDIPTIIPNVRLFQLCIESDSSDCKHLLKVTNTYFESLSREDWIKEFENEEGDAVGISLLTYETKLPSYANLAVKEVLMRIAKGEKEVPQISKWSKILEKTNKGSIKSVHKDILLVFMNTRNITIAEFVFFGERLLEAGKATRNKNTLRRLFKTEILETPSCSEIILSNKKALVEIYKSAPEEDQENFVEVLSALVEGEVSDDLKKLMEILGISLKVKNHDENDMDKED